MQSPVLAPSRINRISRAPMSGFPRAHLVGLRSSPGFISRSLPVFSSLFHFRRPPFPGQLFFTTIFMKTHFQARFFRRPPSLSPSPFPVFRSRFQECPIFGPVFKNARFSTPFSRMPKFVGPWSSLSRSVPGGGVAYRRFSLILILKFPGSTRRSLVSYLSDPLSEPFIPISILRHSYSGFYFKILEFIHLISITTPRRYPSRYQPPESHSLGSMRIKPFVFNFDPRS